MLTEARRVDNLASMANGFYTPPSKWKSKPPLSSKKWMTEDSKNKKNSSNCNFHVIHKVPSGDSPYVKAKHVQLIDKDPNKAVALFWNAINSGDHVDSALKDMAVVMKQLDRSNEAIEAIKSFRHLCTPDSQESLDNVLVELYKRSGRLEEQIEILQQKLKRLEEGNAFAGKRVKLARSQGKKVHITVEQEYARILGNLAWAYLQQNDYKTAEDYYRKALSIEADKNKQCNLAICLICRNKIVEAKFLLQVIRDSAPHGQMDESYAKSFERASLLLAETETQQAKSWPEEEKENQNRGETNRRHVDYFTDGVLLTEDSWNRTYTSPVPARRITRSTPFTQPNRCSSFLDHGNWKQGIPNSPFSQPHKSFDLFDSGNPKPEPYRCVPRRLRFEHSWDSPNAHKESSPAPATKLSPSKLFASESGINEQHSHKKSWADMVEEDEQQKLHDFDENLFINVQSVKVNAEPSKRLNRLQVFKDLTPETPKICM